MTAVCLETGKQRVFATALDWPGWCRAGRDAEKAIEALAVAASRYAVVARAAGVPFPLELSEHLEIVERLPGSASTDYGVPGAIGAHDVEPLKRAEAKRLCSLVSGSWTVFDRVVAAAPSALRKGPRGGGRDRDKIVEHVLGAEVAYASKLGLRLTQPDYADRSAIAAFRKRLSRVSNPPSARLNRQRKVAGPYATPPAASPGTSSTTPGRSKTAPSHPRAGPTASLRSLVIGSVLLFISVRIARSERSEADE